MSVEILLKYFRCELLQFERSKTVSNLGMSRFISLKLCSVASFTRTPRYFTLNFTYNEDKQLFNNSEKLVGYNLVL